MKYYALTMTVTHRIGDVEGFDTEAELNKFGVLREVYDLHRGQIVSLIRWDGKLSWNGQLPRSEGGGIFRYSRDWPPW